MGVQSEGLSIGPFAHIFPPSAPPHPPRIDLLKEAHPFNEIVSHYPFQLTAKIPTVPLS